LRWRLPSKECDGCIAAHAHAAVQRGANPEEAAEAIGVAFLMNGGPATVYGARAFAAFNEFYAENSSKHT
jgi:alkylhydroperoxidase/carboxymuconolactone decarboxylase family protein YurZ